MSRSETVVYVAGNRMHKYVAYRTPDEWSPDDDDVYSYKVAAGGPQGLACVLITAEVDRSDHSRPLELQLATQRNHHYAGCTSPDLERHTTAYLALAALRRVFQLLPNVVLGVVLHVASPAPAAADAIVGELRLGAAFSRAERELMRAAVQRIQQSRSRGSSRASRASRSTATATWQDVYAAINAADGGCMLFGKLSQSAKRRAGLQPLRGQVFRIPSGTVLSWPGEPAPLDDVEIVGGGSAGAREHDAVRGLVDRAWAALLAQVGLARRS